MNLRRVMLTEGPCDGSYALVSHLTAVQGGHVYVFGGGDDANRFVYVPALVDSLPREQKVYLQTAVDWIDSVYAGQTREQPDVPAWLMNLAVEMRRR